MKQRRPASNLFQTAEELQVRLGRWFGDRPFVVHPTAVHADKVHQATVVVADRSGTDVVFSYQAVVRVGSRDEVLSESVWFETMPFRMSDADALTALLAATPARREDMVSAYTVAKKSEARVGKWLLVFVLVVVAPIIPWFVAFDPELSSWASLAILTAAGVTILTVGGFAMAFTESRTDVNSIVESKPAHQPAR